MLANTIKTQHMKVIERLRWLKYGFMCACKPYEHIDASTYTYGVIESFPSSKSNIAYVESMESAELK